MVLFAAYLEISRRLDGPGVVGFIGAGSLMILLAIVGAMPTSVEIGANKLQLGSLDEVLPKVPGQGLEELRLEGTPEVRAAAARETEQRAERLRWAATVAKRLGYTVEPRRVFATNGEHFGPTSVCDLSDPRLEELVVTDGNRRATIIAAQGFDKAAVPEQERQLTRVAIGADSTALLSGSGSTPVIGRWLRRGGDLVDPWIEEALTIALNNSGSH